MRFRFVSAHAGRWPVRTICRALGVSASGYYAWHARRDSARAAANRALLADIRRPHAHHRGRYGSPRLHAALRAEGRTASRGRVERAMRAAGIRAAAARRVRPRTTGSRHALPVAPDLLGRRFEAAAPNRVWLADITYPPTGEGWLYLAAVLDLASREVVGWSMRERLRAELTCAALMMATRRQRPAPGLLQHSDRGSQYGVGVGVHPIPWTPTRFRWRCSPWAERGPRARRSFGGRSSSWSGPGVTLGTSPGSSSRQHRRSETGSPRPTGRRAAGRRKPCQPGTAKR